MINRKMSWKQFEIGVKQIASEIQAKNLLVKNIYGVPRGGLILAVCLSHQLDKPLLLDPEYMTKNTLIVDDISDSGKTLSNFINSEFNIYCKHENKKPDMTCTLFYYPKSIYKPTIWVFEKQPDDWIVFPWE
jgi:hypoxanthine phosphoribosyltransferase